MSVEVNYIATGSGNLSIMVLDGKGSLNSYVIDVTHANHRKIVDLLKSQVGKKWTDDKVSQLSGLCSIAKAVDEAKKVLVEKTADSTSLVGKAEVRDGQVFINNVPVHNVISDRIVTLVTKGFSVLPILRFLELVMENPSARAQLELYDFLANRNLPLTEDGHFLAYKRINQDWTDVYTGKIRNNLGSTVSIPREAVDPDRDRQCSYGLHVGALEYVRGYGTGGRVVIVKVNPRDCIAVPLDYNAQKLRVCSYKVLYEHDESKFLEEPVYSTDGTVTSAGSFVDETDIEEDDRHWEHGWDRDEYPEDEEAEYPDFDLGCGCECDESDAKESWREELEAMTLDELCFEAKEYELITTRQEGRDLGRDWLTEQLVKKA
jgi:hypothetical protein